MSFRLTGKKSYGHVPRLDDAKVAFRAEYENWQRETADAGKDFEARVIP